MISSETDQNEPTTLLQKLTLQLDTFCPSDNLNNDTLLQKHIRSVIEEPYDVEEMPAFTDIEIPQFILVDLMKKCQKLYYGNYLFKLDLSYNLRHIVLYANCRISQRGGKKRLLKFIIRDPETGNSKNYAFINFASFEASDAAIQAMNRQYLCNKPISISYAFKEDSKGDRHGSAAERLLAAKNPLSRAYRPHQLFADAPPPPSAPVVAPMAAPPPPMVGLSPPPMAVVTSGAVLP
ncbi:splicing factor 3B subunit 4-like [Centruroides sculpturatus]|uniref:splicing factor 3B subunit 4-like n=1 Tax=Centruroides sculpturatus TaxID=218467 RepID=UPI000C6DB473|nr:splicing factor 3B subunit 4-like [Centruroides sculpturatus]